MDINLAREEQVDLQYVINYIAIRNLSVRYNRFSDMSNGQGLAALFTEDGEWDIVGDRVYKGSVEIAARCQGDVIAHITTDALIEIEGGVARQSARLIVTANSRMRDRCDFVSTGFYKDLLVRTERGWRIKCRRVELDLDLSEIEAKFAPYLAEINLPSSRLGKPS